jgi:hypothetical protein
MEQGSRRSPGKRRADKRKTRAFGQNRCGGRCQRASSRPHRSKTRLNQISTQASASAPRRRERGRGREPGRRQAHAQPYVGARALRVAAARVGAPTAAGAAAPHVVARSAARARAGARCLVRAAPRRRGPRGRRAAHETSWPGSSAPAAPAWRRNACKHVRNARRPPGDARGRRLAFGQDVRCCRVGRFWLSHSVPAAMEVIRVAGGQKRVICFVDVRRETCVGAAQMPLASQPPGPPRRAGGGFSRSSCRPGSRA